MNLKGNLTSKGLQGSIGKSRMQGILGTNPAAIPITVDNALSLSSTNPVQNRVITQAITNRLWSDEVKTALLQIVEKVAYVDEHGQDYYDALYDALYPPVGLDSIGAVFDSSATIYTTDTLDDLKQYLTVTAYYTDGTSDVLESTEYTLTGTLTAGTSTITVSYGGKTTTFNVTVVELAVASISAVFTQSGTIYTTDTLDTLKQYLTVTATYSDSTTATVSDYTLSGTLAEGTSTITASYGGKSDTFTVTVTNGLDRIAYGTLTYRDIFITNNDCASIGDFETDFTISDTAQSLGDGWYVLKNAGNPVISSDAANSPTHSLKCFGTSSTQIYYYNASKVYAVGRYLICVSAKVDRYSAGYCGIQANWPYSGTTKAKKELGAQAVTNGFAHFAYVATLALSLTGFRGYIGTFLSANADCYVDDVVLSPVPSGMTSEEALALYEEYLAMRGASA